MDATNVIRPMMRALGIACLSFFLAAAGPVEGLSAGRVSTSHVAQGATDKAKPRPKPDPDTPKNKKSSKSNSTKNSSNNSSSSSRSSSTKSTAKPVSKPVSKPASSARVKPRSSSSSTSKSVRSSSTSNSSRSSNSSKPKTRKVLWDGSKKSSDTPSTARPRAETVEETTTPSVRERQPDPPPRKPRQPRDPVVEDPDSDYRPPSGDENDVPDIYFRTGYEEDRRRPLDDLYDYYDYDCTLVVTSSPSGADVYLDEFYLGQTPLTRTGLQAGAATLRIELEGYRTVERYISLRRERNNRISFTLEPLPGTFASLYVTSDPVGAVLFVNGKASGTTPTAVLEVPPGVVHLELRKEGHLTVERDIEIEDGQYKQVEVYLPLADAPESPATIRVTSEPPDAEIYLNGTLLGRTPLAHDGIPPGKAVVFARKEGYENTRQSLPLGSGEDRAISFTLKPLAGNLHIRTNPTGATVFLDGVAISQSGGSGITMKNVAIGSHTLRAIKEGFLDAEEMVMVNAGETTEVLLTLPPIDDIPYDPTAYGQLSVETFPNGVEIFLNYSSTGRLSPALFTGLQPGRYLVSASLDGHGWDEQFVIVRANTRTTVTLNLAMKPYTAGGWDYRRGGYHDHRYPNSGYGVYGAYDGSYPRGRVGTSDPWNEVDRYLVDWDHSFDEGGSEEIADVLVLKDGSTVLAGFRDEEGSRDGFLMKLDPFGNKEWSQTYDARGFDAFTSIAATEDFGFIVAGVTSPDSVNEADGWLMLCDNDGSEIWSRTYGGGQWDGASAVVQAKDKGFYFAGETWSEGRGLSDGWLVKTAPDGFVEWSRRFGSKGEDRFAAMALDEEGDVLLAGSARDAVTERSDGWLVRTTPAGKQRSTETFGGNFDDGFSSIALTEDGGIVLAGYTDSEGMLERNAWMVRLNGKGIESWSRTFGGYDAGIAWDVKVQRYGYILCGTTMPMDDTFNPKEHAWIIRTDFRGEATWYRDFSDFGSTSLSAIGILSRGEFVAVGDSHRIDQPSDAWAMMLTPEEELSSEDDVLITPTGLMLRIVDHLLFK